MTETAFSRQRILSFGMVIVLILRGHKLSMQNALNKFFRALGVVFKVITGSAYSQARRKIKPEVFCYLNQIICQDFYQLYEADAEVKKWRGHRLLGVDGTYFNMPDTEQTRAEFTVHHNQVPGSENVQALASVLYDLCNDIGLDAAVGKVQAEKNFLFYQHLAVTEVGDVLVLDRNYADYTVMAMVKHQQRDFIIRFPIKSCAVVIKFWNSSEQDLITTLKLPQKARAKAFVSKYNLPLEITIRLVKVELSTGEIEILGTSLLDTARYPRLELKQVYGWRWNNETYYDRIKNIFEVERFSSTHMITIKQDFYGVIFLATLEAILIKPAQAQLSEQALKRDCHNEVKVNRVISYVTLIDRVVELFCNEQFSTKEILAELAFLFQTNSTNHRAERKFERKKYRATSARLWFNKYVKRIIA